MVTPNAPENSGALAMYMIGDKNGIHCVGC